MYLLALEYLSTVMVFLFNRKDNSYPKLGEKPPGGSPNGGTLGGGSLY
jgi:hypothetical protein